MLTNIQGPHLDFLGGPNSLSHGSELDGDLVFTFGLPVGWFASLTPVSYATYQVHFKHEQPQVLPPYSHVTIGTIQQTQDTVSVL